MGHLVPEIIDADASDFPHESAATATHALETFLARDDVSQSAKQKILCDNVKAIYGLS